MLDKLIDKFDNSELIRNKVAQILANEIANQRQLAVDAGKTNPDLWNFKVFVERSNPFALIASDSGEIQEDSSLINIWLDDSSIMDGNPVEKQTPVTTIQIDAISSKSAIQGSDGIIIPADERTSRDVERIGRLVRNILMSDIYTYLEMRNVVVQRWIYRIVKFQPDRADQPTEGLMAQRITLQVKHIEFSPQQTLETIEKIFASILNRGKSGEVLAEKENVNKYELPASAAQYVANNDDVLKKDDVYIDLSNI